MLTYQPLKPPKAMKEQSNKERSDEMHVAAGVPSNGLEATEAIKRRAYELWQQSGARHGSDREDWLQAEKEFYMTDE
ncbi:MAG TPA: DUF2934 domain-containing protein [Verrucomicrobiae bacterium]|nr:DUF2934 domain-containing protein [Verrucomicrobiae bacterium]